MITAVKRRAAGVRGPRERAYRSTESKSVETACISSHARHGRLPIDTLEAANETNQDNWEANDEDTASPSTVTLRRRCAHPEGRCVMAESYTGDEVRERYIEAMQQELGDVYFVLFNDCTWLHLKWQEYKTLFGTDAETVELLNGTAAGFFFVVQESFWDDILLHICRMTDPASTFGKENLTVQRLPDLAPAIAAELHSLIAIARDRSQFARDMRNRRIGHRDLLVALGRHSKPIDPGSRVRVVAAIDAISDVLNCVERHFCGGEGVLYSFVSQLGDAGALLSALRRGIAHRESVGA
jgi:AbiU2